MSNFLQLKEERLPSPALSTKHKMAINTLHKIYKKRCLNPTIRCQRRFSIEAKCACSLVNVLII